MKLNRKRKDARFPNWVLELLASLQIKYQWTFTEALIRCAEKGAAYYNKQWQKMHPNEKASEEAHEDERCPNDRQNDYNQNEPKEEVSDQEVEEMLDNIYGKDRKK